jgi:GNAT superfamily N-acetyltransferase
VEKTGSLELKSTTLGELASHPLAGQNPASGENIPVSPLRLESYIHNPRADGSDAVLFEAYLGKRLVAYRTLLPDAFHDARGRLQRFAWLSGNYVDPGHRRQGLSTRLLQMAEEKWDGRLMYTNYATASKALYDRTGRFILLAERTGSRFYLRSATSELLRGRLNIPKVFLQSGDRLVNFLMKNRLRRTEDADPGCQAENITDFNDTLRELIGRVQKGTLFGRDADIFNWILEHPWITDGNADPIPYHFSYSAFLFRNIRIQLNRKGSSGPAFMWMVLNNQKLTIPYVITDDPEYFPCMADQVIQTMINNGSAYTTIRHPGLHHEMMNRRKWFLAVRPMPQLLFVHDSLAGEIPIQRVIQDGDGDVVFSG